MRFGKILVDVFAITIRAFDKSGVFGDLQIHPWVPQRAFATVARDAMTVDDLGFRCFDGHHWVPLLYLAAKNVMGQGRIRGKASVL